MAKEPQKLHPAEIETLRRFIEATELDVVSDEVREAVERYLPKLKHKLPPKRSQVEVPGLAR